MENIVKKLLKKIKEYNIKYNLAVDIKLIEVTINFIKEKHKDQIRYSGEPYYHSIYEVLSDKLDFDGWQASIDRKLEVTT